MCKIIVMLFESYVPPALVFVQLLIGIGLAQTHPKTAATVLELRFQQCREGCLKKVNFTFYSETTCSSVPFSFIRLPLRWQFDYDGSQKGLEFPFNNMLALNTNIMWFCTFVKYLKLYFHFKIFNGCDVFLSTVSQCVFVFFFFINTFRCFFKQRLRRPRF